MNVLDLAAFGLLSGAGSYLAVNHASGTLRIPIMKGKDSIWNDWRTVIGIGSLLALPFTGDKGFARMGFGVLGAGAITSLAATEAMRYATIRRAASAWGAGGAAPGNVVQFPGGARPLGAPVAALPAPGSSPANPIPVTPAVAARVGFGGFGLAA